MADYTGSTIPDPVTFFTRSLRIVFSTDNYLHGDGFTFHWNAFVPEGVQDYDSTLSLALHPNPAQDFVTVNTSKLSEPSVITIFDLSGKAVLTANAAPDGKTILDISRLNSGVYMVRLQGQYSQETQKLIITR